MFWGMPAVELEPLELLEPPEACVEGADVGMDELLLDPPQPAAANAMTAITAPVAATKRDLRIGSVLSRERHASGVGAG